ncbi:nuclear factor NF-kappa-B p100 subunit isoform X2 [Denticeps clupeoides]|nr:nuclear factor NF-kappa-B p100 subunit-like isoform X2 [Denticeps clupeoides]
MDDPQCAMKIFDTEPYFMDYQLSYQLMQPLDIKNEPYVTETVDGPYIQIIEEPKQRGFRFRYECEGPSHGGLPGASSERNRRTYPTVKILNYLGRARIEVQLVTNTDPPRVHAHSLVGKQCNENGICTVDVGPNDLQAQFNNLGILHVTKRGVTDVLAKRLRMEKRKQKEPGYQFTEAEDLAIVNEAKELGKDMDLNIVRLKFTAYLQDSNGGFTRALKPVVSNPIYDSKSPNASNLKISRMDKTSGSVLGGDEVFLLCDKVQKDDIDIRFYEEDGEGWEAFGDFSPTDVHKQYAIVFKTPAYHMTEIERPVTVFLQLKRKKGGDCSEPKQFTYVPQVQDKEEVQRKKMKPLPHQYDHWPGSQGGAGGAGRGGFGGQGGGLGGGGGGFRFNSQIDNSGLYGVCGGPFGGGLHMSAATSNFPQQQLLRIAATLQTRASTAARCTARALLEYCSSGDVRFLLDVQRHLCGVQDENGDTPLHMAIIHQQPTVVQQLLHSISRIPQQNILNKLNNLGQSPLHLAVITKQTKVAEVLLRAGADPSLLDKGGRTVVHLAAHSGDEVMLRLLLSHLEERHSHLVNTADFAGLYPLHLAVRKGGERCLRLLVEGGAKINAQEHKSGFTSLHLAVRDNQFKVTCTLITELKADINLCNFGGNTPLHLAASQGSPPLCSMLIAAGANKYVENDEPLSCSSASSDDEEGGKDEKKEEQVGAEEAQHVQAVSSSLQKVHLNPRKRTAAGHTPLDLARCQKVKNLLESNKDSRSAAKSSHHESKRIKQDSEEGSTQQLDGETLSKLCGILSQGHVPWRDLAEKLGMLTLAHLYQESPSPCQNLLENYQLSGGPMEGLVEALQSLGLNEGVRLLRETQPREDKHSTDTTVDSGFDSQMSVEEGGTNPATATS